MAVVVRSYKNDRQISETERVRTNKRDKFSLTLPPSVPHQVNRVVLCTIELIERFSTVGHNPNKHHAKQVRVIKNPVHPTFV